MVTEMCPVLRESRRPDVIKCLAVTTVLALSGVIMRFASRRIAGTKLWWDDYLILCGLVPRRAPLKMRDFTLKPCR